MGNPNYNYILEKNQLVLGNFLLTYNIQEVYVDKDEPRMGILESKVLLIFSTRNIRKGYNPGKFIFGRDIILLIKYNMDRGLILQKNRMQINSYNNL